MVRFAYSQSHQGKDVVTVAPDFLIFLNGDLLVPVCDRCGAKVNFNNDVTDVNISLSTDGGSGSASFSLTNPRHRDYSYTRNGSYAIAPMSEVEIFMKGRFLVGQEPRYYQVFWGLVESVSEDYSDGSHTFSVNCVDILRWWSLMYINVHPSAIAQRYNAAEQPGIGTNSKFFQMNPYSIIYALAQMQGTLQHPQSIRVNDTIGKRSESPLDQDFTSPENVKPPGNQIEARNQDMIFYWQKRFNQIGKAVRIFGLDSVLLTSDDINLRSQLNADKRAYASSQPFSNYRVSIADYVSTLTPFPDFTGTPNNVQSDYRNKLDIAKEVADFIGYEFYMDVTGEVIFKPPFYNLDVRSNPILKINDKDIINYSISESETPVYTRCDVYGDFTPCLDTGKGYTPYGWAIDQKLARQYGLRTKVITVSWMNNCQACHLYAAQWLDINNAKRVSGSVTVVGRPEIRLGYPIYIESKDAFYYVKSVSHNLSVGGQFTTRIDFVGVRRKFKVPHLAGPYTASEEELVQLQQRFTQLLSQSCTPNAVLVSSTARERRIIFRRNPQTGQAETAFVDSTPFFVQQEENRGFNVYEFGSNFGTYVYTIKPGVYQLQIQQQDQLLTAPTGIFDFIGQAVLTSTLSAGYNTVQPVTDESGYDLIGVFPYGRNLRLDSNGKISFKAVSSTTSLTRQVQTGGSLDVKATAFAAMSSQSGGSSQYGPAAPQTSDPFAPGFMNIPMTSQNLGINRKKFSDLIKAYTEIGQLGLDIDIKCTCYDSNISFLPKLLL